MGSADRDRPRPSWAERLAVPLVQRLTDAWVQPRNPDRTESSGQGVHLGTSPVPHHPSRFDAHHLPLQNLMRHLYICGATSSGKTFGILILLMALVRTGVGFTVLDVAGDLSRMLLGFFATLAADPALRQIILERLVIIDAFDPVWAPALNVLAGRTPAEKYRHVADLVQRLRTQWQDSWGPRLEELLTNCLLSLALADRPRGDAPRFLTDAIFRAGVVATLADPLLVAFWRTRYDPLSEAAKVAAIGPVLNKLGQLLNDFHLRYLFASTDARLDLRRLIDQGAWIVVNLAKGTVGANAKAFGAIIMSLLWGAALGRVAIAEAYRRLCMLVIDEFQNFLSYDAPIADILSEARKYRLGLVMAHQNIAQLSVPVRDAIFGNVGSMYLFRLGLRDAPYVTGAFRERDQAVVREALLTLGQGQAITRTPDGGFRLVHLQRILAPTAPPAAIDALRQASFDRYYVRRADLDRQLALPGDAPAILRPTPSRPPSPQRPATPPLTDFPEGEL